MSAHFWNLSNECFILYFAQFTIKNLSRNIWDVIAMCVEFERTNIFDAALKRSSKPNENKAIYFILIGLALQFLNGNEEILIECEFTYEMGFRCFKIAEFALVLRRGDLITECALS